MDSAYRIRNVYFGSDYFDSCRKKKGEEIFFCFCFCDYRCIMLSTNGKTFVSSWMALCHIWDRYMGCDGTDSVVSDWSVIHFSMYAEIVKYSSKYFGSLPVVLSEPRIAYLLYIKICDIFIYNILLCIGGKTDLCKMLFAGWYIIWIIFIWFFCAADHSISV